MAYLRAILYAFPGQAIDYICCKKTPPLTDISDVQTLPIFSYNDIKHTPLKALSYLASLLGLLVVVVRKRYKYVHFQWCLLPPFDLIVFLIIRVLTDSKVVLTVHNIFPHEGSFGIRLFTLLLYRLSNILIVHTEDTKSELSNTYGIKTGKINVVNHGLIKLAEVYHDNDVQVAPSISQKLADSRKIFLFFGSCTAYKGFDKLISAWSKDDLHHSFNNSLLVVIGTARDNMLKLSNDVSNNSSSYIALHYNYTDFDLSFFIKHATVIVMPHAKISQSGMLFTALPEKKPILVSNLPGLTEPFKIFECGLSFDGSENDLRRQLCFLSSSSGDALIHSITSDESGWSRLLEFYSVRQTALRISAYMH